MKHITPDSPSRRCGGRTLQFPRTIGCVAVHGDEDGGASVRELVGSIHKVCARYVIGKRWEPIGAALADLGVLDWEGVA
jgi:hypothetical protein